MNKNTYIPVAMSVFLSFSVLLSGGASAHDLIVSFISHPVKPKMSPKDEINLLAKSYTADLENRPSIKFKLKGVAKTIGGQEMFTG